MPGDAAVNPYEPFGLNPDGSPLVKPEPAAGDVPAGPTAAEFAAVKTELATANARLAKLPSDFEGMTKKFEIVDRLVKAFAGEGEHPQAAKYKEAWSEIKEIARVASPEVYKNLERWEKDPTYTERLERGYDAIAGSRLAELNTNAHQAVLGIAKGLFKGASAEQLDEIVMPFEGTMTSMINANGELKSRFASGDMTIVKDMFNRLIKPHVAARLREKQDRLAPTGAPKAPPKSGGPAGAGGDDKAKPNIKTPAGRAQFHKEAVGRWLDRSRGDAE